MKVGFPEIAGIGPFAGLLYVTNYRPGYPKKLIWLALEQLRLDHQNGSPAARSFAFVICKKWKHPVPDWLRDAQGEASSDELNPYRRKRTGRHATLLGFERDRMRKAFVFAALREAERRKYANPKDAALHVLQLLMPKAPDRRTINRVAGKGPTIGGTEVGGWLLIVGPQVRAAFDFLEKLPTSEGRRRPVKK